MLFAPKANPPSPASQVPAPFFKGGYLPGFGMTGYAAVERRDSGERLDFCLPLDQPFGC